MVFLHSILCNAEILVDLHDALPADFHQIFKGHHGVAHLQGAEHRVDAVCFSGQCDVVTHCWNLRVGGVFLEVPHRDGHALDDLHQPVGQSRHFFLGQNALGHTFSVLFFCGKLLIMRRNQIISDVFLQLNFMEQRGSGIDRILNSYAEVAQNPVFYSDSDIFLVTLLN